MSSAIEEAHPTQGRICCGSSNIAINYHASLALVRSLNLSCSDSRILLFSFVFWFLASILLSSSFVAFLWTLSFILVTIASTSLASVTLLWFSNASFFALFSFSWRLVGNPLAYPRSSSSHSSLANLERASLVLGKPHTLTVQISVLPSPFIEISKGSSSTLRFLGAS